MLKITEYPRGGGDPHVWFADDDEDFCIKVLHAHPHANFADDADYEEVVAWLSSALLDLEIEEVDD